MRERLDMHDLPDSRGASSGGKPRRGVNTKMMVKEMVELTSPPASTSSSSAITTYQECLRETNAWGSWQAAVGGIDRERGLDVLGWSYTEDRRQG